MENLKSLAIVNNNHDNPISMGHTVITSLLEWLLPERNKCLERLWISDDFDHVEEFGSSNISPPFLKSLAYNPETYSDAMAGIFNGFKGERYAQMEHIADVPLQRFDHLPNLKYFRGHFDKVFLRKFTYFELIN